MAPSTKREMSKERLIIDLVEIIERKHRDLLRVTNAGLVTLFWEIGKELNEFTGKNEQPGKRGPAVRRISNRLVADYGPYLTSKNIKVMGRFYERFPDRSVVEQMAPFISWEHVQVLLKSVDPGSSLYFIRLIMERGLSVSGLRKQMSAYLSERPKTAQPSDRNRMGDRKRSQLFELGLMQAALDHPATALFFQEPLLSSFRPLTEFSKEPAKRNEKNTKASVKKDELFGIFSRCIGQYRHRHNRRLNSYLNSSFREIGNRINREIHPDNNEGIHRLSHIRNAADQLKKKYGQKFNAKKLNEMATFAGQITDLRIVSRISYMVSWHHILALLPLKEIEAKLFYARLTATQGLSVVALRKKIAQNVYEQTKGAKEREQSIIAALLNPGIKNTKGNVAVSTVYINFEDINKELVGINIFQNPYFSLLAVRKAGNHRGAI